jgi:hypothetical protein
MRPLSLSDQSIALLLDLAKPLHPDQRSAFLESVAARLRDEPVLGDGIVSRIAKDLQRLYLKPPDLSGTPGSSKYR